MLQSNEKADAAARQAAENPRLANFSTPPHNPYADKWWPLYPVPSPSPSQDNATVMWSVPNLGRGLKQAVHQSNRLGYCNRDSHYLQAHLNLYADTDGAHPSSSNAMWRHRAASTAVRRIVTKVRFGGIHHQGRAVRYGWTTSDACLLCGERDSGNHSIGACRHPHLHGLRIKRHDRAVHIIHKHLQHGREGGNYCIIDAGTMTDVLNAAANGKRVPDWLLPDTDPDTRQRMRPDILRITGLPANASPEEIEEAQNSKRGYTVQIIEVGYGQDSRWRDTLERKQQQHKQLAATLRDAGWVVEEHVIVLGNAAHCYHHNLETFCKLGLTKTQAEGLMTKLHIHSANALYTIIQTREVLLSRFPRGPPPRVGIG